MRQPLLFFKSTGNFVEFSCRLKKLSGQDPLLYRFVRKLSCSGVDQEGFPGLTPPPAAAENDLPIFQQNFAGYLYKGNVGKVDQQTFSAVARARAAAGSDARMSGCSLPVVINSGSGNQGMTVSLPVIEFAKEWNVSQDKLYRALVVSNLIAVHQKKYIGSLSAYCGAVSAGCGAGAAITYLSGGSYEDVSLTIVNTIGNVGGIVCDGAKSSCAAKIASAVDAAILAHYMGQHHRSFQPGEGIVREDVEDTIKSMGYIGGVGMKDTDTEILNIMIDRVDIDEVCK